MEEKEKQKYGVLNNTAYIYMELWSYDKKTIIFAFLEILLAVLMAYGAVYLPSYVVRMLEQNLEIAEVFINVMIAFFIYALICGAGAYRSRRNQSQYVQFRSYYMANKLSMARISLDYFQIMDDKLNKLFEKATEAVYWGNIWGIEAIINNDVQLMKSLLGLLLYMFVISSVNPWIVLFLTVISLFQITGFKLANGFEIAGKEKKAELNKSRKYLEGQAYNVASGKDIRLYQLQNWLGEAYEKVNKKYQKLVGKERRRYFAKDLYSLALQLIRDVVCYMYLIAQLKLGMSASAFVLHIGIVAGFSSYFSEITTMITENLRAHKSVSYFREYINIETELHHGTGKKLEDKKAIEVEFSHVSFSYQSEDANMPEKKVLDDVSFKINIGEKLALVGINGAGKTTIVKLICGLYKPDSGHIYINGIDITELDIDDYYKSLAVVFQDAFIFPLTIADNVACSTEDSYDKEKCIEAITKAGLWEKISELPKQEQTYIEKYIESDGIQLSGGQLQKLLLARALYKDCGLLLLDEPTAALDAIAESEMYEKYNTLLKGKTSLFISHRLASTRFCDNILFLEGGQIIEKGTHEELMQLGGQYAHMFEVQSQYYKEGTVAE